MICAAPPPATSYLLESYTSPHPSAEVLIFWLLDRQGALTTTLRETGERWKVDVPLPMLAHALAMTGAAYVFMAHNHPSGDPRPSAADIEATRQIWRLTRTLGASLQDHLVIGRERWFSFRSQGLL